MKLRALFSLLLTAGLAAVTLLIAPPVMAAPVTGLASSTGLPTAQVTGIVWASVTVGDTVYATGRFTKARPAGVAAGGAGEVTRSNVVAFSISTGKLTAFAPSLNAEGLAIEVSADHTKLYVGGLFTTVNGQSRAHLAAFAIPGGTLLPMLTPGPSGKVLSLAAAQDGRLYVGGAFGNVGTAARGNLARYTASGVFDPSFTGTTDSRVSALIVTPDGGGVVAGGSFATIRGAHTAPIPAVGLGAFFTGSGEPVPYWASSQPGFPLRFDDPPGDSKAVTSLSTDGVDIFGSGFNYQSSGTPGAWEGTFAIDVHFGKLIWGDNCHGDTYDTLPIRGVLYSVSHAHDCTAIGAYPEVTPRVWHRANAQTTTVDGVNVCGAQPQFYTCYAGMPRSSMLTAFAPTLNTGTFSGAGQAAWTVTGNNQFVVLGGEFGTVNGKPQQGLARFAIG